MSMTQVGPLQIEVTRTPKTQPSQVASIKDITREKRRIKPRKELPEELLKEFVAAINDACENGVLPYQNYRLNQEGSPHQVQAHYFCTTLDPVYLDVAKKLAMKEKMSYEEAVKQLTVKLIDYRKAGLAFIVTTDAKKFWYHGESKVLYHDRETKGQLNAEEKKLIGRIRKLMAPGKEDALLRELGKA